MPKPSQNVKENFSSSAAGQLTAALLAAAAVFTPMTGKLGNTFDGSALAQDTVPVKPYKDMSAVEKADAVRRYSMHNNGVGVFINFAAVPELPPEKLITAIKANFAREGIPVHVESNASKGNVTTTTFLIKGVPIGGASGDGYLLGEIPNAFKDVVEMYKEEQVKPTSLGSLHAP